MGEKGNWEKKKQVASCLHPVEPSWFPGTRVCPLSCSQAHNPQPASGWSFLSCCRGSLTRGSDLTEPQQLLPPPFASQQQNIHSFSTYFPLICFFFFLCLHKGCRKPAQRGAQVGVYEWLLPLLQSCLTLCDPIDGSPLASPVPGILQTRTLEWVAISFSNA